MISTRLVHGGVMMQMSVGSLERACGSHCQRYSIPVVRSQKSEAVATWAQAKTEGSEWLNDKKSSQNPTKTGTNP